MRLPLSLLLLLGLPGAAVAEEQLLGLKTTDGPADVITQGT